MEACFNNGNMITMEQAETYTIDGKDGVDGLGEDDSYEKADLLAFLKEYYTVLAKVQ